MAARRLLSLPVAEQKAFFDSFDTVLCDVDDVLLKIGKGFIDGAPEAIKTLRRLGKKIYLVTNNSTTTIDVFLERIKVLEVTKAEIVRPANLVTWYLQDINFTKELYVLGFKSLKDELKNNGIKVVEDEVGPIEESVPGIMSRLNDLNPNVGAVLIDFTLNFNLITLQKCVEYIEKNKAIFIKGASDRVVPLLNVKMIGSALLADAVSHVTKVEPKLLTKPGKEFQEVLEKRLGPFNSRRTLFIGDSAASDMLYATNCGFQKMAPLTGYITEDMLQNWDLDSKVKPDLIVDSIKDICTSVNGFSSKQ